MHPRTSVYDLLGWGGRGVHALGLSARLLFVASLVLSGGSCAEKTRVTTAPPLPIVYVVPVAKRDVPVDAESVGALVGYDVRARPDPELVVPERALISSQGSHSVAVVGSDLEVELRKVELGGSFDGLQIIRKGVAEGESVVVDSVEKLYGGLIVDARPAANEAASAALRRP